MHRRWQDGPDPEDNHATKDGRDSVSTTRHEHGADIDTNMSEATTDEPEKAATMCSGCDLRPMAAMIVSAPRERMSQARLGPTDEQTGQLTGCRGADDS